MTTEPIWLLESDTPIDDGKLGELLRHAISTGETNDFFSQFRYYGTDDPKTLITGEALLSRCQNLDPSAYARLHKGNPFYWLARAAFLVHDYETGAFYIDAAVSEDIKHEPANEDTPARLFFRIETDDARQFSKDLVQRLRGKVDVAINSYRAFPGARQLAFGDIQACFLRAALCPGKEHLRTLATTFISYLLEWEHRSQLIKLRPEAGTAEPFFLHLFKGCLLFESLLKSSQAQPEQKMLGPILQELKAELGFSTNPAMRIGGFSLPQIVNDLTTDQKSLYVAVERTGRIRNTTGHDLGWHIHLNGQAYDTLANYVTSSCLHAIVCLYVGRRAD